jgi:hypothetical protein
MPGAWIVIASLVLGPPPPPEIIEPAELDPPGIEFAPVPAPKLEPGEPPNPLGIEVPPPPEGVAEGPAVPPHHDPSLWPDPGTAPPNGSGAFVTAGAMIPAGVLVPLALLRDRTLSGDARAAIISTGVGIEVIAALGLGIAVSRRMKFVRWAGAYRVQPTPQGGGLLTFGGIALAAGTTLVPLGIWTMARVGSGPDAIAMLIGGSVSLGLAPLGFALGKRRRDAYLSSGGWYRRPLPPITLTPSVLMLPGGFGVSFAGRF